MNKKDIYTIGICILLINIIISISLYMALKPYKDSPKEIVNTKTNTIKEHTIDSINKYNTNVINNIKHINVIQHEEIEKVKTLNNDSTVKLFYKLLNE